MKPHEPDPETKLRTCLTCMKEFMSEWCGNRMCNTCKRKTPDNPVHGKTINHTLSDTGRQVKGYKIS